MIAPTTAELVEVSTQATFTSGSPAQRDRWVAAGRAAWLRFTGAKFELVAADDEPLVFDAVRGLSELAALDQSEDRQETLADFDLLKSFSAGSYNETRRDADDARKARALVAWPWLNTRLWDFMTPDKRAYWIDFFANPGEIAAAGVTEVDWTGGLAAGSSDIPGYERGGLHEPGYDYPPGY